MGYCYSFCKKFHPCKESPLLQSDIDVEQCYIQPDLTIHTINGNAYESNSILLAL